MKKKFNPTDNEIKDKIESELAEALSHLNLEDSIDKVVFFNRNDQSITVKFKWNIVEDDNYVGLACY